MREYADLRERLEESLPKLSKDARPEEIERHKRAFQEVVRSARAGAKQGDVFTPEAAAFIRDKPVGERLAACTRRAFSSSRSWSLPVPALSRGRLALKFDRPVGLLDGLPLLLYCLTEHAQALVERVFRYQ